jgi:predicted ATPase
VEAAILTLTESHSALHKKLHIARDTNHLTDGYFLRSESFFNVATQIELLDEDEPDEFFVKKNKIIDSYGGRSLHEQSHGGSFWTLFKNRFGGNGFYILDEPEAALSPARQLEMLGRLHQLVLKGLQFIIGTHSPIIISYPYARVFEFDAGGMHVVNYQNTKLFKTYQAFFDDHFGVIDEVLEKHQPNGDH